MKIITPATTEPITLALARKQCRVDPEGSPPVHEDDELIELFLSTAREWCEAYLGKLIAPTLVEISGNEFADEITLESGPVLSVESITYYDEDGAQQTIDPGNYELDTTEQIAVIRLVGDATWPTTDGTNDNIRVRYTIGYSVVGESPQVAPLPKSIKTAILLLTNHLYENRSSTVEKALSEMPMGVRFFLGPIALRRGFA